MMKKWRMLLLIAVAVMALSTVCFAAADEYRAFWIDVYDSSMLSKAGVDALLGVPGTSTKGQIRDANCNMVIVQMRKNCDAAYPSSMGEPYMSSLTPADFNALQAIIDAAHDTTGGKQRVEVHAWLVTFRTSGGAVYAAHHSTPTGSLTNLDNYWPSRTDAGAETGDKAFDPGHPLAEEYITNVFLDVANNFDVDGIHYDYIRFTAGNQGYNPTSVARYNARYGLTGQPSSTDDQWDQWRRDQVTNLVRKIYAKVQITKPNVKVSGAFVTWNPSPTASTRAAFQTTRPYGNRTDGVFCDWDAWMQEGIVDMCAPMTYYDYSSLPSDWANWIKFIKDRKFNRHAIIGPGLYMNSLSNSILELQQTRTASPAGNYANGFAGYSHRAPYTTGGTNYGPWSTFAPQLLANVTQTPANIPNMPWKSAPTKGHICGTVTYAANSAWADGATVAITGPESRTMLCDGTGFYAFIDLTPGTYNITVSKTGYPNSTGSANVQIGAVTGNMYVKDFLLGGAAPPTLTSVAASNITTTSARITWQTIGQASTSKVDYGTTTAYGSSTPTNSTLVTSHSMTLTGLTPGTRYHYRATSSNANGVGMSGDYAFVTLGPPAISTAQAIDVASTSATITWSTNVSADGRVDYGTTAAYGSQAAHVGTSTAHTVALTGLTPETTYHFRCVSTNAYGTTETADLTFITDVIPEEIVIDNSDPEWSDTSPSGSWNVGSATTVPKIGDDYLYFSGTGSTTSATRKCRWTPNLPITGNYDVWVYYQIGQNRNSAAPYTVHYDGGELTSLQDQYDVVGSQGGWFLIGANLPFQAGTSGYVELTNASTDTFYVSADAAKWVYKSNVDTSAPVMNSVTAPAYNSSISSVECSWSGADPESGIAQYEYAVGSTAGDTSVKGWTSAGTATTYTISGLSLTPGATYYISARAVNGSGLTSSPMSSTGVTVDTTAPIMASIADDKYTTSTTSLYAAWSGADPESGIQRYEYGVSSMPGAIDMKGWTNAGTSTSVTITDVPIDVGGTYYISARAVNNAGLTSAPAESAGVTVAQPTTGIVNAKSYADNLPIYIPSRTVTAKFADRFYIEETDRFSGLCIQSNESVVPNQLVEIYGKLGLIDGRERAITNAKVVKGTIGTSPVRPLFMLTRTVGGKDWNSATLGVPLTSGLNNIGLLVQIAGTVTDAQTGYIYVDDGSVLEDGTTGIRVDTTMLTNPPAKDDHVIIKGISTIYFTGSSYVRMIRAID